MIYINGHINQPFGKYKKHYFIYNNVSEEVYYGTMQDRL